LQKLDFLSQARRVAIERDWCSFSQNIKHKEALMESVLGMNEKAVFCFYFMILDALINTCLIIDRKIEKKENDDILKFANSIKLDLLEIGKMMSEYFKHDKSALSRFKNYTRNAAGEDTTDIYMEVLDELFRIYQSQLDEKSPPRCAFN